MFNNCPAVTLNSPLLNLQWLPLSKDSSRSPLWCWPMYHGICTQSKHSLVVWWWRGCTGSAVICSHGFYAVTYGYDHGNDYHSCEWAKVSNSIWSDPNYIVVIIIVVWMLSFICIRVICICCISYSYSIILSVKVVSIHAFTIFILHIQYTYFLLSI